MYEEFFALKCRPFDLAPDPRFIYMTAQHSRAVANIKFALLNQDSFVIITGEIGIGKTTILNAVLQELGPGYVTAKLIHTTLTHIELLQALLSEFGMPNYTKKKVMLLDTLRSFFLEQNRQGKHVVIIVDEAQNLSTEALEELRLLSCIDTSDRRIVSIVLTGQPGLDDLLDAPGLTQLRQRCRLRQKLDALGEEETIDYLRHRLQIAGGNADEIFTLESMQEIHRLTAGIPRLINTLCDTALTACMVENHRQVGREVIDAVVQELRWQWFEEGRAQSPTGDTPSPKAPASSDHVTLMVYRGGQLAAQVEAGHFPFVLGRSNANDLVIIDKEVSRRHALIDCIGGIFVVEDLNSRNGIQVNHKRRARALLRSGDIITLGQVDVVFYLERQRASGKAGHTVGPGPDVAAPLVESTDDTGQPAALSDPGGDAQLTDTRQSRRLT